MPLSRIDSLSPERDDILPLIYDTIIIGAGPCGLATAARLREHTPSAIFTDEEHHRYHWISKHAGQATIKNSRTGAMRALNAKANPKTTGPMPSQKSSKCNSPVKSPEPSILVLDSSGDTWLSKWNGLFSLLDISHLRSPMFFHPDPRDRDGLLAYAHLMGREDDCVEIAGCVGKELSKHAMKKRRNKRRPGEQARACITIDERDRKDYFTPPSDLFKSYCDFIAKRYRLLEPGLIQQATVSDIDYDFVSHLSSDDKLFTISTSTAKCYYARSVVLAVGAGNSPTIPPPFPQTACPRVCHAFQPPDGTLKTRVRMRQETNVLVVGGGLTSAQVADRAIRQGATRVFHIMRGPMKVKPFDVDLSWMGKFRNHEKATFWSADDDQERATLINLARNGGSITPRYARLLHQHRSTGKLHLYTHTRITSSAFSTVTDSWTIQTDPPTPPPLSATTPIHYIYFATGVASDFCSLPYCRSLADKYPVPAVEGLPALTDDLQWSDDVPLFVTGKFAALRLGPGAGNLEGARTGAERIAWALGEMLGKDREGGGGETRDGQWGRLGDERVTDDEERVEDRREYRYAAGIGSRFEGLMEVEEEGISQ